ncbi:MAG: 5'/3'-nucleotidase SurE [Planctomycetota bacterium]
MRILLTNDDGIYAPGLAAMQRELAKIAEVSVVAPATEQSGVGHSITFLTPLMAKEVFATEADGSQRRLGWAVEGSPADCVKLGLAKFASVTEGDGSDDDASAVAAPDLVVSGINGGLNVGINVLYSGTVAAASEAALNDVPAIAISLEYDDHARFDRAAVIATRVIAMMRERNAWRDHLLYNVNIPTSATADSPGNEAPAPELLVCPMNVSPWPAVYDERRDPKNRRYYWAAGTLPDPDINAESDLAGIRDGKVTLTPLSIDRTHTDHLPAMRDWNLSLRQE